MDNLAQAIKTIFAVGLVLLMLSNSGTASPADPFAESSRDFADKILAVVGKVERVGLKFQSLVSLRPQEATAARKTLEGELRARGVLWGSDTQSATTVKITLSENFRQYLWVAEIQRGRQTDVIITAQPRFPVVVPDEIAVRQTIQSRLLYEQDEPILDAKLFDRTLLILDTSRLALFRRSQGGWDLERSVPLTIARPLPRDCRGRLSGSGEAIQVHLPGLWCSGAVTPSLSLECSPGEKPWPFEPGAASLAPGGNNFTHPDLPAFFAASAVWDNGSELWVVAAVDGHAYLFDGASKAGTIDGWGSDIAAVNSECGGGRQILAVLPGDPLETGAIQAFEIVHRKAVAVSSILELPGPVTALWPSSGHDGAVSVSRDKKTGRYAAFHLSISCSH